MTSCRLFSQLERIFNSVRLSHICVAEGDYSTKNDDVGADAYHMLVPPDRLDPPEGACLAEASNRYS